MIHLSIRSLALWVSLSLLAFAPGAFAVDGVTLINQATSTNGLPGCAHAGFPITICKPGSYRLSGDLTIVDVTTDAIDITASNVSLDLNGFNILGPVTCQSGTYPVVCSGSGAGTGVNAFHSSPTAPFPANVTVRNGTIRGMGNVGLFLGGPGSFVEDLHVDQNATWGIYVRFGVITRCTASTNGSTGFVSVSAAVNSSTATYNGGYGFQGIAETDSITGRVIGGTAINNSVASNNGQDGIFDAFLAVNNTSTYNVGLGLHYDGNGYGYLGNVMYGNTGGAVSSLGSSLGHNLCNSVAC